MYRSHLERRPFATSLLSAAAVALALTASACPGGALDPTDWPDVPPGFDALGDTGQQDIGQDPGNDTPVNDTPVNDTPVNDTPVNDTPVAETSPDVAPDGPACIPTRQFWDDNLFDAINTAGCPGCHAPGGFAIMQGAEFMFDVADLDATYATARVVAAKPHPSGGVMLAVMPSTDPTHPIKPFPPGNATHNLILEFVDRVANPVPCDP